MDVQMSEMDGFEATGLIRAWELERDVHTPIIAMTAHALSGDRERCLEAGMDDYLSKPLQPKVFFHMIERWTQHDRAAPSPRAADEFQAAPGEYSTVQNPAFDDEGLFGEELNKPKSTEESPPAVQRIDFSNTLPMYLPDALYHFDGDREFMLEMFTMFLAGLPDRLADLRTAFEENNPNQLARISHNIKGTCLNFGTEPLAVLAAKLEELGKQENIRDAAVLVGQMSEEVTRLQEFAKELI
jgi:HPt (histidine-containing phosphotransfer) domain-containing protein